MTENSTTSSSLNISFRELNIFLFKTFNNKDHCFGASVLSRIGYLNADLRYENAVCCGMNSTSQELLGDLYSWIENIERQPLLPCKGLGKYHKRALQKFYCSIVFPLEVFLAPASLPGHSQALQPTPKDFLKSGGEPAFHFKSSKT